MLISYLGNLYTMLLGLELGDLLVYLEDTI